jgi:hypothetical protein
MRIACSCTLCTNGVRAGGVLVGVVLFLMMDPLTVFAVCFDSVSGVIKVVDVCGVSILFIVLNVTVFLLILLAVDAADCVLSCR